LARLRRGRLASRETELHASKACRPRVDKSKPDGTRQIQNTVASLANHLRGNSLRMNAESRVLVARREGARFPRKRAVELREWNTGPCQATTKRNLKRSDLDAHARANAKSLYGHEIRPRFPPLTSHPPLRLVQAGSRAQKVLSRT